MRCIIFSLFVCASVFSNQVQAGVIADGDFLAWSFSSTGTATVTREANGGNTGPRLNLTTVSGPSVYGTAIMTDFSTIAQLAGASFSLSIDVLSGPGSNGQGQAIMILVEQAGTFYG